MFQQHNQRNLPAQPCRNHQRRLAFPIAHLQPRPTANQRLKNGLQRLVLVVGRVGQMRDKGDEKRHAVVRVRVWVDGCDERGEVAEPGGEGAF